MWDLIVSVPYHCLSFYSGGRLIDVLGMTQMHTTFERKRKEKEKA